MAGTGATQSCLASTVAPKLNLRVEPHANVIIILNGVDNRVDDIVKVVSI